MAAIELPPDYFGNRPPVFGPLVQTFDDALGDVHSDVARTQDAWTNGTHPETLATLGGVDADDDTIAAAVANEHGLIVATPTGDALAAMVTGDTLTLTADNQSSAAGNFHPDIPFVAAPPPDVPIDVQNAPGVDTQGFAAPLEAPQLVAEPPPAPATLPQETSSSPQPMTEPATPSVAPVPAEAPSEAILTASTPVQASEASPVPSSAAPYVTRDELLELLGQLEATVIVMA